MDSMEVALLRGLRYRKETYKPRTCAGEASSYSALRLRKPGLNIPGNLATPKNRHLHAKSNKQSLSSKYINDPLPTMHFFAAIISFLPLLSFALALPNAVESDIDPKPFSELSRLALPNPVESNIDPETVRELGLKMASEAGSELACCSNEACLDLYFLCLLAYPACAVYVSMCCVSGQC
jgi:hypothetical protein